MLSALCALALLAAGTPDPEASNHETLASPTPAAVDTVPESAQRMAGPAEAARASGPARPRTVSSTGLETRFRLRLLGGVSRWLWNEVVEGRDDLEESGYEPDVLVQGEISKGPVVLGGGFEGLRGAIDYDGYLQNLNTGALTTYRSSTYYLFLEPAAWLHLSLPLGHLRTRLGARLSAPWWRRTIDASSDGKSGRHGYIETWSGLHLSPECGLEFDASPRTIVRLEGALVVPRRSSERVDAANSSALEPDARTGKRLTASILLKPSFLVQIEWFAMDFGESDPVPLLNSDGTPVLDSDKLPLAILQPESSLDRLAVRLGWEL